MPLLTIYQQILSTTIYQQQYINIPVYQQYINKTSTIYQKLKYL